MKVFSISADNQVVVFSSEQQVSEDAGVEQFRSREELVKLARDWRIARLVEIWNGLAGVKPVRKFEDRDTAVRRMWKAMQSLGDGVAKHAPTVASPKRVPAQRASKAKPRPTGRHGSKTAQVIALLRQPAGATLQALMRATHWQAPSVRGFLSGQVNKKMKLKLKSFERDGERVYAIQH